MVPEQRTTVDTIQNIIIKQVECHVILINCLIIGYLKAEDKKKSASLKLPLSTHIALLEDLLKLDPRLLITFQWHLRYKKLIKRRLTLNFYYFKLKVNITMLINLVHDLRSFERGFFRFPTIWRAAPE